MSNILELKFDKWVDIILFINNEKGCYTQDISNKLEITWSHVANLIRLLNSNGLINRESDGKNMRIKLITLTKKGQKVQELLKEVKKVMSEKGNGISI